MAKRKLRGGMIGGATGSFIGPVHRMAATMDGQAEFVAGAFSTNAAKSKKTGRDLYLDPKRVYGSYKEMIKTEAKMPADKHLDFITIVAPNNIHYDAARTALQAGFNVVCEKPLTTSAKLSKQLKAVVKKSKKVFALTHNYTGYPMVKQAQWMVGRGMLGKINKVVVEYPQGWASGLLAGAGGNIAGWRMDPRVAGISCCIGDIGIHAENLVRYITGLKVDSVCCEISSFIPANPLEDDANILVRYKGGAIGILYASQISTGEENGFNIRVYGTKQGMYWNQEDPNYLVLKDPSGIKKIYSKGNPCLCKRAREAGRLPFGHPDGFIEAFANIYLETYRGIRAEVAGKKIPKCDHPDVDDGIVGNAFIEASIANAKGREKWTKIKY